MDPYAEVVQEITKNETTIKTVSLLVNIFLTVGMVINILDNDFIRDLVNGEYKFQRSTPISAINSIYSFIVFASLNVYDFIR